MAQPIKPPTQSQPVIKFFVREHYGRQSRYFLDSPMAFAFKRLSNGRTVILDRDMEDLGKFGFRFEEVPCPAA